MTPHTIWMFWGGPMAEHLVACVGKADRMRGGLDLIVVTPETARTFAPGLPASWEDLPTWAHRSDVLAPHLLDAHGGLYMDVDTVPVRSIERFVDRLQGGGRDFEVFRNQWDGPSVGVMWSRPGGRVTSRYLQLIDERLADDTNEMRWTELGTPLLRQALEDVDRAPEDLAPMIGNVALFTFRGSRSFDLPSRDLAGYIAALTGSTSAEHRLETDDRRLEMVALYNSRTGEHIANRTAPTIVDDLLDLDLDLDDTDADRVNGNAAPRSTIVVKTFNRPRTVEHAMARLRASFPDALVVVVDGSEDRFVADLRRHDVAHVVIDFDSGLSRGRNMGVQLAATPYVLLLDDDQFPAPDLDLEAIADVLDQTPDLHGVGGWEDETPHVRDHLVHRSDGMLEQHRHRSWTALGTSDGDRVPLYHMVQNQVMWRRSVFDGADRVWWTDRLKVGEHVDFFFRHRGRLAVTVRDDLHVENVPQELRWADRIETDYARFRGRQGTMWDRFKATQGVSGIHIVDRIDVDFEFRSRPWRSIVASLASLLRRPRKPPRSEGWRGRRR